MKARNLALMAGTGSLILTAAASADFTGVSAVMVNDAPGGTAGLQSWAIYANFDNAGDDLLLVGGIPGSDLNVLAHNAIGEETSFNQTGIGGGDLPAGSAYVWNNYPAAQRDSFFTIGILHGGDGGFSVNSLLTQPPVGFGSMFVSAGHAFGDVDGGFVVNATAAGTPSLGSAGAWGNSVLIAYLTINDGDFISGSGGISYNSGLGSTPITASWEFTTVPAPGAMALLGLAGLVGSRRRRTA